MEYSEYKKLYDSLVYPEDVERRISEGYDTRLIETLYTQKVSREVKKRYHVVKGNSKRMLKDWNSGKSFMEIAKYYKFPPILIMMMIFQENGTQKKQFWEFIRDPDLLESPVAAKEVREATAMDFVYSPAANDKQRERGQWGEALLQGWLDRQGVEYMTENDIRDTENSGKTPDCLLREPMLFKGHKICWIESKASFGDSVEFRFNSRKQLCPYTELFGPGVVVYWTGYVNGLECPPDVFLEDISILNESLKKITE